MDIVERLRNNADERFAVWQVVTTMSEAADEIERLREELDKYDDILRDAGWYLTDDGGNDYKTASAMIIKFLMSDGRSLLPPTSTKGK